MSEPVQETRFVVSWHDYPAALQEAGGDEERAAEACHDSSYWRESDPFEKFQPAVRFALSKRGDDFFGNPRIYRVAADEDGGFSIDVEFWDCCDPDEPMFEAHPTVRLDAPWSTLAKAQGTHTGEKGRG